MKVQQHYELDRGVQYHIRCGPDDIGEYVLLPGDPGRIGLIAGLLENVREVAYNREHRTITGYYKGLKVSATSTGMGCPSTAIAVEELIRIGAKVLVRVGSTAGIADQVQAGDYILPTGAVALDGTSRVYLQGDPFCAVPDFDLAHAIYHTALARAVRVHTGLVLVNDAFYGEDDEFMRRWHSRNVLSVEMESSILFTLGTLRQVKTAAFHLSSGNVVRKERAKWSDDQWAQARRDQHQVVLDAFLSLEGRS